MLIGKQALCALIPHDGRMCLLEGVVSWNDREIHCVALSHTSADNPLRRDGRLAPVHLLEYGAQAMAVHGGLRAASPDDRAAAGYLAALRDVKLPRQSLECIASPLQVFAQMIAFMDDSCIYRFRISADDVELAHARATVMTPGDMPR